MDTHHACPGTGSGKFLGLGLNGASTSVTVPESAGMAHWASRGPAPHLSCGNSVNFQLPPKPAKKTECGGPRKISSLNLLV